MQYKSDPYRWVILICVFPILAVTQIFWLTFSAISPEAVSYYHTSSLGIAFLSMSYMIVYILLTIPASLLADRKGLRASFILGAAVTAVFGLLRGFCAGNFALVVIAQMGMAIAQPFLVNPITKLAAVWFPVDERATVSGVASIAGYFGIIIAMLATPTLYHAFYMAGMLRIFGYISVGAALIVFVFLKEKPKVPAGPRGNVDDQFSFRDVPKLKKNRNFMRLLIIVFIVLGIFNALLTCISDILGPRGINVDQSGIIGGVIIVAGLFGAIIIPLLSDKLRKRRIFITVSVIMSLLGMLGISFLNNFTVLIIFAVIIGFFLMGAGPLIFQYGTEIAYPVPEGTSYGLLMGSGQISGIAFIILLYVLRSSNGMMTVPLALLMVLMSFSLVISLRIQESLLIQNGKDKNKTTVNKDVRTAVEND
jgi:sugar phosphate permease